MDTLLKMVCEQAGEDLPANAHAEMSLGMRQVYVGTLFILLRELWEALHSRYRLAVRNTPYDSVQVGEHPPLSRDNLQEFIDKIEYLEYGAQLTTRHSTSGEETGTVLGRIRADMIQLQEGCSALRRYADAFEGSAEEEGAVAQVLRVAEHLRPGAVKQPLCHTLTSLRTCLKP